MNLQEAKQHLRDNFQKGTSCPCCGQYVKLYKRRINSGMALFLIGLYKLGEGSHSNKKVMSSMGINTSSLDYSVLKHFKLITDVPTNNPEKRKSGYWRITDLGKDFVNGYANAPSHVLLYNGVVQGFTEERVSIIKCLGNKFNYYELMK